MKVSTVAISAAVIVLVMAACVANKGDFVLINSAKEPIARALVTICGQRIEIRNIQPTKSAAGSYKVKSDGHYDVKVEFQSGKQLQKQMGYVTNGLDFQHQITVTNSDIDITDSRATLQ